MLLLWTGLVFASKLRITPFQIIERGCSFDYITEVDDGWKICTQTSELTMQLNDYTLQISQMPVNVLVAGFTEDRMVFHSQPHLETSALLLEGSEVIAVIHTQGTPELAHTQAQLDANSSCTKDEFIQLVRSNTSQDWAMIEAKIEKQVGWLRRKTDNCCAASNYLRNRPLKLVEIVVISFTGLVLLVILCVILPILLNPNHDSPFIPFSACGSFDSNGTRVSASEFLATSKSDGEKILAECAKRYNISWLHFPYGCPDVTTEVSCDF